MALTFQNFCFFFEVLRVVPHTFISLGGGSKVSALLYVLHIATVWSTFENCCEFARTQATRYPHHCRRRRANVVICHLCVCARARACV